jgi:hypothetical protein
MAAKLLLASGFLQNFLGIFEETLTRTKKSFKISFYCLVAQWQSR